MKTVIYRRIALENIKKNYRFFVPRILTEAGLLGCFYIILTLTLDDRLKECEGGSYLPTLMGMGAIIIGLLSVILMFYTNSFLMKQRKKEFGLYNVLGMEKKHVGKVLFFETFICALLALVLGLALGVLFYKVCSLLICKILESDIILGFYFITPVSLIPAGLFFLAIDVITYIFNRISIARLKPIELLASKVAGEKEPKVKWPLLVLGIICLGAGYYISITTTSPLKALLLFFVAVLLVIFGTYFLFVSGSIFVLKSLKKNKPYYYNKKHFSTVSGLLYRMKQNAVGLASIAILATGVLVMISTTVSLYAGMKDSLNDNYPQHLYLYADIISDYDNDYDQDKAQAGSPVDLYKTERIPTETLTEIVQKAADKNGIKIKTVEEQNYLESAYVKDGNSFNTEGYDLDSIDFENIVYVVFISDEMNEKITGSKIGLEKDEIAICRISSTLQNISDPEGTLNISGKEYKIVKNLQLFPVSTQAAMSTLLCYGIIVSDEETLKIIYDDQKAAHGNNASEMMSRIAVTFENQDEAIEKGNQISNDVFDGLSQIVIGENAELGASLDTIWDTRSDVLGMYGSFLFLGILLGFVCLFATVLIIYYKQISEGYDDRERFQIMKKVGMSEKEVKRTIKDQILLVFFLPLIVAGIHICFAFPILERLLHVLLLSSTWLFIKCTIIVYLIFAVIYIIIYMRTARTYYKIVK